MLMDGEPAETGGRSSANTVWRMNRYSCVNPASHSACIVVAWASVSPASLKLCFHPLSSKLHMLSILQRACGPTSISLRKWSQVLESQNSQHQACSSMQVVAVVEAPDDGRYDYGGADGGDHGGVAIHALWALALTVWEGSLILSSSSSDITLITV